MMKLYISKFCVLFIEWLHSDVEMIKGVVADDDKQPRRTGDTQQRPLHVVSAFSSEARLVLWQITCEEKGNEVTAISKLLEVLELSGCIVTIDTMGTQTKIVEKIREKIREKIADYFLILKMNQSALYEDASLFFMNCLPDQNGPFYTKTIDMGRDRIDTWECMTSEDIDRHDDHEKWAGLGGIWHIRS